MFDWDPAKAASNLRKHKVSFELAATVFLDPFSRSIPDDDHSQFEERWVSMGCAQDGRLLVVCHTDVEFGEGDAAIRIISARAANPMERRQYESRE